MDRILFYMLGRESFPLSTASSVSVGNSVSVTNSASVPVSSESVLARLAACGELANTITHGTGFLLSVAGSITLMTAVIGNSEAWLVIGCGIYVATLLGVYGASTLSHAVQRQPAKYWFRSIDQAAIFLMIAGNFTPFALAYNCSGPWWVVIVAMWIVAILGFVSKILWNHRIDAVRIGIYVVLGWMPLLSAQPTMENAPAGAIVWGILGGICYSIGTFFLMRDDRHPWFHPVWHIFVIAGSTCHFLVILKYVVGA